MAFWSQRQFQDSQDNKRSQLAEHCGGTEINALPPNCSVVRDNGRSVLAFLKHMDLSFAREA